MKMIEVLQKVANGEIEKGTKFILGDNLFIFNGDRFKAGNFYLGGRIFLNARDLNREVDLIPPKEQKYRIKLPFSNFYVCLVQTKDNGKEIMPYIKDNPTIEALIQVGIEKGLEFKTEFTEKDFEKTEELQPYKPFKELVKDDKNEID